MTTALPNYLAEFEYEIDGVTQLYSVHFDYEPEEPDVHYLPNGDPGYPGHPASVEITELFLLPKGRDPVPLGLDWPNLPFTEAFVEAQCWDHVEFLKDSAAVEAAEAHYCYGN